MANRDVHIRSVRRQQPDIRKLSRALITLALQAQAEAEAEAQHRQQPSNQPKPLSPDSAHKADA